MPSRVSTPARNVEVSSQNGEAESPYAEGQPAETAEVGPSTRTESSLTSNSIEAEHDDDGGEITRADFMPCSAKPTMTDVPFSSKPMKADDLFGRPLGRVATGSQPAPQLTRTAARKIIEPAKYCGGAQDLDWFIAQVKGALTPSRSNSMARTS